MNMPESRFLHPLRRAARRTRRGFALIVTLSLMTLLLLLVLALTTLVQLNLNGAKTTLYNTQAKQNALLAAYIAIGQLQKFAGPDQRVTTTADIGRYGENDDTSANNLIGGLFNGNGINGNGSKPAPVTPNIAPFGASEAYTHGGTRYWTAVWGEGTNPLSLYTGQDANGKVTPSPILMNWLVSGNENTPLQANTFVGGKAGDGTVAVAPGKYPTFSVGSANPNFITSKGSRDFYTWNALTSDLTIQPNDTSKPVQPAVVLVGPNSAGTNNNKPIPVNSTKGGPAVHFFNVNEANNLVVVPVVNISEPSESTTGTVTSGRYAWFVQDEGVKAKYNIVDPYAGQSDVTTAGATRQLARYHFSTPTRTGIERMTKMDSYTSINNPTTYSSRTAAALNSILDPSQVLLIDPNLTGITTPSLPQETMQLHYHDFTTYSYGVLADALRGGLRYDLTAAFEPGPGTNPLSKVFTDVNNGLQNRAIIPANTTLAPTAATSFTTEPYAANSASPLKNIDFTNFHGPAAQESPLNPTNKPYIGLKWDVLQSYYALATNNTGTQKELQNGNQVGTTPAVLMRSATNEQAGISPVLLEARLRFGQYSDKFSEQYIAIQPLFVLANPYNFPITDPGGGIDIGFRINMDTKWEWAFAPAGRNNDRNVGSPLINDTQVGNFLIPGNDHGHGTPLVLGYDRTQNAANPGNAAMQINPGWTGADFYSQSGASPDNDVAPPSGGVFPQTGYYPFLKNPVSFSQFRFPGSGFPATPGNVRFNSALDQIAFHIPHINKTTGEKFVLQPGEAKVFVLADNLHGGNDVTASFTVDINNYKMDPNLKIVAAIGTASGAVGLGGGGISNFAMSGNQIAPVTLQAYIPQPPPAKDNLYVLRDTGINTGQSQIRMSPLISAHASQYNFRYSGQTLPDNPSPGQLQAYALAQPWPDPSFGYISTCFSSVAMTIEVRYDMKEPSNVLSGGGGVIPVNAGVLSGTSNVAGYTGSYNEAAVGTNILQSLTGLDLSGDGYTGTFQTVAPGNTLNATANNSPQSPQGYRRQFLGTQQGGFMPCFLMDYAMAMSLPGPFDQPLRYDRDNNAGGTAYIYGNFDPAAQGVYRTYYDYNLRAANMAMPPFVPLNLATISNGNTGAATPYPNPPLPLASGFINMPPYGRIFNQGLSGDNTVNPTLGDTSYTAGLGQSPSFQHSSLLADGANLSYDTAWGYALGGTYNIAGGTIEAAGQQFNILYGIPQRGSATPGTLVTNPNYTNQSAGIIANTVPDVPIISLGQLQHADVTADDVWVSVGYQPGNAIGNSYFNFYVSRNSSVQTHTIAEGGWAGKIMTAAPYSVATDSRGSGTFLTLPSNAPANAYDISYLMNVALWDRYFFSSLSQTGATINPANPRLKYAAGLTPSTAQLGLNTGTTTVTDPVSGMQMFSAYAPARYMMIDGAFNINSTSVEAWRAILSSMRSAAYSNTPLANGSSGANAVSYFPRNTASPDLANETSAGARVNAPITVTNTTTGKDAVSYAGFRQLTDYDIDVLANKIVQQIHFRGPFLSLAQFINRRLTPKVIVPAYKDPTSISGTLQTAIDISSDNGLLPSLNAIPNAMIAGGQFPATSIASSANQPILPGTGGGAAEQSKIYPDVLTEFSAVPYADGSADPYNRLVGMPGWLTQADLLEALAPILAARSDTFVIRTYGEVLSPQINQKDIPNSIAADPSFILSRAWCEMVVQRLPDYVDTTNDPSVNNDMNVPNPARLGAYSAPNTAKNNTLTAVNATFGRRFRIVSVKWLSPTDI